MKRSISVKDRLLLSAIVVLSATVLSLFSAHEAAKQVPSEKVGSCWLFSKEFADENPATVLAIVGSAHAQDKAPDKADEKKDAERPRGRVSMPAEARAALHANAVRRNGEIVKSFPKITAPSWDCRELGNVLPVNDQGNCGSCYLVSAADGASMALIKSQKLPLDPVKGRLSAQFGLDCKNWGGCNGGDEAEVIDYIYKTGIPLTSDYGPYTARPGRCKQVNMPLYKLAAYGFCTPNQQQGVASTQDMMNAIVKYGPISVAFDAGGCNGYRWPNVMKGGGRNVDHAVLCIGWRTSSTGKIEFLGMNQWGSWGGPGGTFWIEEGAYAWGTEAIWMDGGAAPTPVPPTPTPPVPPGPGPVGPGPVITSVLTASGQVGANFTYTITASGSPTAFGANGLPTGLSVNTSTGVISGTPTAAAVSSITLLAINSGGAGTATLTLTVGTTPVPPTGKVTITLTDDQVRSVINQSGAVVVTPDMTIQQVIDAMKKVKEGQSQGPPCCLPPESAKIDSTAAEIAALKRGMTVIMDRLDSLKVPK